ncbi:MAG: ATP-binding cassette domain-containing protein [Rhodospirillaceae bacterium]|nr:ATP-binding cassette domain-containing protein [Rhodospirillaceae bacterium]
MPAAIPQLAIRDAAITFGGKPLFSGIDVTLGRGERVCLVGANGSGKSTILKALAGEIELDHGTRFLQPGIRIGYLPQGADLGRGGSVAEYVASGGRDLTPDDYRVATLLDHVQLDGARDLASLSGGEGRRAALARTLAAEPDLLLLDEPTNHLDLPTIQWLEEELAAFPGGILMISHDRAFLRRLTQRLLWLDRGRMFERDGGFDGFEDWSQTIADQEAAEFRRLEKRIEQEEYWLRRGVTARRSRNEGRRRNLFALRKQKAESLKTRGRARLQVTEADLGGRLAIEAIDISKHFTRPDGSQVAIVDGFSTRILRGDRVGILGPNGAGKTTLIKLLTGVERPDSGEVKLGLGIAPIYLDQRRESFDLDKTLWETLAPGGGDSILVNGQQRHIVGYLRDFLFDERQATMPVRALSGGERARLMLAKLFAKPSNLIVLDEPTNDLDMDTLDLLQDVLSDYEGTLLLVSHDRDFLDRLVTSTIAVEGDGDVQEYAGGYSDYVIQRGEREAAKPARKAEPKRPEPVREAVPAQARFSMKEQCELADITARLDKLHAEIATLEQALADPELYQRDPAKAAQAGALLARKRDELHAAEERWLELEEKRAALGGGQ